MAHLSNLYVDRRAFKIGILPSGQILTAKDVEAEDGTLVVSGNSRKQGEITLQISEVFGTRLVSIQTLSRELQLKILERVNEAIRRARLAAVFLYEAAWRSIALRNEIKTEHRLQTLPQEVASRQLKVVDFAMNRLGARVKVAFV